MSKNLSDVLAKPWKQHPDSADTIVGDYAAADAQGNTTYAIAVSDLALIPQILMLQNAAHKGYLQQQKLLSQNVKLQSQLVEAEARANELARRLEDAIDNAANAAANSIASLFDY